MALDTPEGGEGAAASEKKPGRGHSRRRPTRRKPQVADAATAAAGPHADADQTDGNVAVAQRDVADVARESLPAAASLVVADAKPRRSGVRGRQPRRRTAAGDTSEGSAPAAAATTDTQAAEKASAPTQRLVRGRRRGRRGALAELQPGAAVEAERHSAAPVPPEYADDDTRTWVDEMPPGESEAAVSDEAQNEDRLELLVEAPPAGTIGEPAAAEAGDRRSRRRGRRGRRGRGRGRRNGAAPPVLDEEEVEETRRPAAIDEVVPDEEYDEEAGGAIAAGAREMVINVSAGDECRIAVVHEGRLEELFIERTATQSHVGNIYKGRVTNVEPSIQAVFVDFGLPKNGFLHISDVQPQYFPHHHGESEDVGRKIPRHHRPPIQRCFRRGQEVIVQITKEGVGTKGPTLTTYLSIPGRYLVMMPGMNQVGVSRKIEDDADRRKMRDMLKELELPPGMGFIMRTAGLDRSKRELQRDLHYLHRLWKTVVERVRQLPAPAELYRESDLVIRTIRDVYTGEFRRIVVDDAETAAKAREFLQIAMPRSKVPVELYTEREPVFHRFGIEQEIERINMRHVPLKSGGSLVIDSTEAMVTIDVNSGKFRSLDDAEESAYKINLEAAEEIARQLRLRDLGGLIVCDFIDLRMDRHKRAVEKAVRDALKKHKERARVLRMSPFGLIEMTRQRQGPSIKRNIYFDCPHCRGAGVVKMPESVILDVMRIVQLATHHELVQKVTVCVSNEVAFRILNKKRSMLAQIEAETGKTCIIRGDSTFTIDQIEWTCEDSRGQAVTVGGSSQPAART
ncbi:MAG: Rne/Rng family ribonuclease [Planctomycetes bacterium]|nr:Rne/Rng family ribonuclease [Planctomycetota bacterium]